MGNKKMKQKGKRQGGLFSAALAYILAAAMVFSLFPASAVQAQAAESTGAQTSPAPAETEADSGLLDRIEKTISDLLAPGDGGVTAYVTENANPVADPDTTNVWTNYTRPDGQPSTQNVGRIWTDKSVFNGTYTFTNDNDSGLSGQSICKGRLRLPRKSFGAFLYVQSEIHDNEHHAAGYRAGR